MYACGQSDVVILQSSSSSSRGAPYSVLRLDEGVVDGDDLDAVVLNGIAKDNTSNTTEAVDTDLYVVC